MPIFVTFAAFDGGRLAGRPLETGAKTVERVEARLARLLLMTRVGSMGTRARHRGYTLVELMIVVVMVAVLATLAVYGVRKYVLSAKSHEFTWVMQDVKAAQESYRLETHQYLNVSASLNSLYPNATPNAKDKTMWGGAGNDSANWQILNLSFAEPVQLGYACVAGAAGQAVPQPGTTANIPWPTPAEPWYVVRGVADMDGDGTNAVYVSSSFNAQVYIENEGQ